MSPGCLAGRRTGKWVALVNRGSSQPFGALNQTISMLFYNDSFRPAHAWLPLSATMEDPDLSALVAWTATSLPTCHARITQAVPTVQIPG